MNVAPVAEAFALRGDLAVVQLDDVAGDRQSESEAAAFVRALGLAQAVEDVREERRDRSPPLRPSRGCCSVPFVPLQAQVDVLAGAA